MPDPNAAKSPEDEILDILLANDPPASARQSRTATQAEPPPVPMEVSVPPPRGSFPPAVRSVERKAPDVPRKRRAVRRRGGERPGTLLNSKTA